MINLKRINGKDFALNCDLIETIEQTPDTVITLMNGKKVVVQESIDDIINKVIDFKRQVLNNSINRNEV